MPTSVAEEEFVGSFTSWTDATTAYNAQGNAVADDTAAMDLWLTLPVVGLILVVVMSPEVRDVPRFAMQGNPFYSIELNSL